MAEEKEESTGYVLKDFAEMNWRSMSVGLQLEWCWAAHWTELLKKRAKESADGELQNHSVNSFKERISFSNWGPT